MGVVLVLVDLAIFFTDVPGHGTLADTDVALLGVHGGGRAAEVPIQEVSGHRFRVIRDWWFVLSEGQEGG